MVLVENDVKYSPTLEGSMANERKKRKLIKSCTFCRRRKLKCDQLKPVCSSCKARDQVCEYIDLPELIPESSSPTEVRSPSPETDEPTVTNELLLDGINNLQRQIQKLNNRVNSDQYISPYDKNHKRSYGEGIRNPVYDFAFVQVKSSGRRILYGATSMRTYVVKDNWGFGEKCHQLMSKLKSKRNSWKEHGSIGPGMQEVEQMESKYDHGCDSLITEVCKDLPTYEQCFSILGRFFAPGNDELYQMNRIVDSHRVMNDYFFNYFVGDSPNLNGDRPILRILPSEKRNYHKVGVVLMIICIVHYKQKIPESVLRFITSLTGLVTSKIFYIERVQFLALRCEYQQFINADGDNSNSINLINNTVSAAITLGLNRNIRQLYAGQENVVGTLDSLESLWLHIVLMDFECSFQVGKPLTIPTTTLDQTIFVEHDLYSGYMIKLIKFLNMARPMQAAIMNPEGQPDLKRYCSEVFNFVKKELPPLNMYTEKQQFQFLQFRDIRLFSLSLQMLLAFVALRFAVYKERSIILKDITVQCSLILLKTSDLLLKRCFKMDEIFHPETLVESETQFPPYMCLTLYLTNGLFPRVASVFCPLLYHKITRFETGNLIRDTQEMTTEWDFSTFSVTNPMNISVIGGFDIYCDIVSHFASPEDPRLQKVLERSQYMNVTLAIEKLYRTILKKTLEFRTLTETSWNDKDIELASLDNPQKSRTGSTIENPTSSEAEYPSNNDIQITTFSSTEVNNQGSKEQISNPSNNYPSNTNTVNIMDSQENPEAFLQAITDEFWSQYNVSWGNVLDDEVADDLWS